jgi:hypothetical protein
MTPLVKEGFNKPYFIGIGIPIKLNSAYIVIREIVILSLNFFIKFL